MSHEPLLKIVCAGDMIFIWQDVLDLSVAWYNSEYFKEILKKNKQHFFFSM